MRDNRHRVLLQHEYAQIFFESALHPDLEELRMRDRFLEQIARETPYYEDDGDLIAEIPDIDVKLLMGVSDPYQQLKDFQSYVGHISKEVLPAAGEYYDIVPDILAKCLSEMRSVNKLFSKIYYHGCSNGMPSVKWGDTYQQSGKAGRYVSCVAR